MSKLADLLNPAPSSAPASATQRPAPINVSPSSHRRNESITSPLEALALAATTAPPLHTPTTAVAPASTIPPNPYAIKPHFSPPPATTTYPHPPPANPYATSSSKTASPSGSGSGNVHAHPPPSPARAAPSFAPEQPRPGTIQSIVKREMADEPAIRTAETQSAPEDSEQPVKSEITGPASVSSNTHATIQSQAMDLGAGTDMTDVKASVELPTPSIKKPVQKKGMAKKTGTTTNNDGSSKKAAPRKRKLDPESSKDGTPFSQRSDTPMSRISKTPARKNTPQQSSPPPSQDNASIADEDADGGEYVDENEVFCVCRKPDDHTWMIGCDGGCDDWFHGRCVGMKEKDSELIDKYVCPNCQKAGRGMTMWKPMCRLESCRRPARVTGKKPSKYCSDEHGKQFMEEKVFGKKGAKSVKDGIARKRRKQTGGNPSDEEMVYDEASSDDGHQAHLRGGVLKPGELKALVSQSKSLEQFKKLGERVATPETTAKDEDKDGDAKMTDGDALDDAVPKLQYSSEDQARLNDIGQKKDSLESQIRMLSDKEKFLNMVKLRHKSVAEELKKKEGIKDICGYDSRLTWSEPEFDDWRQSEEGKHALETKVLSAPTKGDNDGGANGSSRDDEDDEVGRGVCKKKRCEKHKQWAKQEQNEINLARSQCWHNMRKLEGEEAGVKERATIRQLEAGAK